VQAQWARRVPTDHQFYINRCKTLELERESIYCLRVTRQSLGRLGTLWIGLGLLALLGVGACVVRWDIGRRSGSEYDAFTKQNIQLSRVFARAADAWLDRGNADTVEEAADLLLVGSAQYVRITVDSVIVLDKRRANGAVMPPDLTEIDRLSDADPWHRLRDDGLDVAIPIELAGLGEPDEGIVQVGFSDAQADSRLAQYRRLVLFMAGGSWSALALMAVLVGRLLALRKRIAGVQNGGIPPDGIIRRGGPEIDTASRTVRLNGQPVDLTPKTFELLLFLARNEGKTYSDAELLEALWADASYAASNDVKQCIYLLRRRLGAVFEDPKRIIVNIKGFGYRLESPNETTLNED